MKPVASTVTGLRSTVIPRGSTISACSGTPAGLRAQFAARTIRPMWNGSPGRYSPRSENRYADNCPWRRIALAVDVEAREIELAIAAGHRQERQVGVLFHDVQLRPLSRSALNAGKCTMPSALVVCAYSAVHRKHRYGCARNRLARADRLDEYVPAVQCLLDQHPEIGHDDQARVAERAVAVIAIAAAVARIGVVRLILAAVAGRRIAVLRVVGFLSAAGSYLVRCSRNTPRLPPFRYWPRSMLRNAPCRGRRPGTRASARSARRCDPAERIRQLGRAYVPLLKLTRCWSWSGSTRPISTFIPGRLRDTTDSRCRSSTAASRQP